MKLAFFRKSKLFSPLLILTFTILILRDLLFIPDILAQTSAGELLKRGKEQYEAAEFDNAIKTLNQALAGLSKKENKIEAMKYLAFSYAALDEKQKSKKEYLRILDLKPDFDLPSDRSPTLRDLLEMAKREFKPKDTEPPNIDFTPPAEINENIPLNLTAKVTDASDIGAVRLYYKGSTGRDYVQLSMHKGRDNNSYEATIPASEVTSAGLDVYITASDIAGNGPAKKGSKEKPLKLSVGKIDTEAPVITHNPVTTTKENTDIVINAEISDHTGVDKAVLYYRISGRRQFTERTLQTSDGQTFSGTIPARVVTERGIEYYIHATDLQGNPPAIKGSSNQPLKINVTTVDVQPPSIEHIPVISATEKAPIKISAEPIDRSEVKMNLYYKSSGAFTYSKLEMQPGITSIFTVEIPASEVIPDELAYYLEAIDSANNSAYEGNRQNPLIIKVDKFDTELPNISHTPPVKNAKEGDEMNVFAVVTDNVGVADVTLFYRVLGESTYQFMVMARQQNNVFLANITVRPPAVEYYIAASDVSGNAQTTWQSKEKPQILTVQSIQIVKKGGGKIFLWIGIGAVAIGGGLVLAFVRGDGTTTPVEEDDLPSPPGGPGGN